MRDDARDDTHRVALETLARAEPARLKAEAEAVLPLLGDLEVLQSRTGLVMLPMRDTVQETDFHLGDVLVAEAHVRLADGTGGYGLIVGRDLERAMAMAVMDAARSAGIAADRIAAFLDAEARAIAASDTETLRRIEVTRVEMETF
jgi:alpha-D-ribose 1-methylphosphonate 5-triphosphate synthase subunit PhnG